MENLEEKATEEIHQTLLCQGPVELKTGWRKKKRRLSLFSDVLVASNNLLKRKFKIQHLIPLSCLWVGDCVDIVGPDKSTACRSIQMIWPMGNFVATFRSMEQKVQWYFFLRRCINEVKKVNTKHVPLQIFTEDIPSCASPLNVRAANTETVDDIIKEILSLLGMSSVQNYQLWFSHGLEEAARPLQGYEYPYDIIMNNIHNTTTTKKSKPRTAFPSLPGLNVEHLSPDTQGRFFLKPKEPARSLQQNKDRTAKNRLPFLSQLFQRGSVPQQKQSFSDSRSNHSVTALPVTKEGKLFGNDLTSVCEDGNLPTPIMKILSIIKEKGPKEEGIFRKSASKADCQALKEKLDVGEEVDLDNECIHVLASVLKDFLRNIRGSVLTTTLYEKFLDILDQVPEEEKLASVQRLLEQLPPPNIILLRHIFRGLHKIARLSSFNKMTPYNLSVCIARSVLNLPGTNTSGLLNDTAKKITLVKFLIRNSVKLFGEDPVICLSETTTCFPDGEQDLGSLENVTNTIEIMEKEYHHDKGCASGGMSPTDNYVMHRNTPAPLDNEGLMDSENPVKNPFNTKAMIAWGTDPCQDNVCITQEEPVKGNCGENLHSPPPIMTDQLRQYLLTIFEDGNLPMPIQDILSAIKRKGPGAESLFRTLVKDPCIVLKEEFDSEKEVNWNEGSGHIVASVLKISIMEVIFEDFMYLCRVDATVECVYSKSSNTLSHKGNASDFIKIVTKFDKYDGTVDHGDCPTETTCTKSDDEEFQILSLPPHEDGMAAV